MKFGFTLVELSIVLVIVGLLIGGILVGQSMIDSAKINRVVRQISSYDIAIATFYTKYKQLPGDSSLFGTCGAAHICNNNKVSDGSGYEPGRAWYHLSIGTGLKNVYNANFTYFDPFNAPGAPMTQNSCPILKDLSNNPAATTPCLIIYYPASQPGVGYYRYDADPVAAAQTQGIISANTLMPLDAKMDDGKTTGSISGSGISCVSGADYLKSDVFDCRSVTIRTGIATGFVK